MPIAFYPPKGFKTLWGFYKNEREKLLSNMNARTAKATANKKAAVEYLVELGVLTGKVIILSITVAYLPISKNIDIP